MYDTILIIALDALLLMAIIKWFADRQIPFQAAALVGFGTAVGMASTSFGLSILLQLGAWGVLLTVLITALSLAAVIALCFGLAFHKALLSGTAFAATHIILSMGIAWVLSV